MHHTMLIFLTSELSVKAGKSVISKNRNRNKLELPHNKEIVCGDQKYSSIWSNNIFVAERNCRFQNAVTACSEVYSIPTTPFILLLNTSLQLLAG